MKETNIYQKNNTKWPKTEQIILIKWQCVNICFFIQCMKSCCFKCKHVLLCQIAKNCINT